ncbi:PP2C family protein-serine/threonine phosphatase [Streptomyces sp. NL15-2K]|uniref:PP2C family protein-serine/threonine phosphatase n=1 Tax=Streptomyces sp. NL15-2K TaxID=376149 RepID=UPI000F58E986|nr:MULTISPECIES: SpoIIE family protein phosphatase [Actinomycetes]WKX13658.1 SpoIIE family protein phosphatase [Kutzneria buriramensis]GCB44941.1 serine phosphatase rsbU [Streptomyces sp. NL15-2K]
MTTAEIDFEELFDAAPNPYLVLDADLVVRYANRAYLQVTGRTREGLVGRYILEAFPDTPAAPEAARDFGASLQRVLDSREPDVVAPHRFDISVAGGPGDLEERWWCGMSSPVLGPDGTVKWIIARADDVTEFMRSPVIRELAPPLNKQATGIAAQVYARSHDLEQLNEQLRQAHAHEREIAVTLQEVMLRSPDLDRHRDIAVRYLPASGSLNVCGDWYDVVDLPPDRCSIAVGDVVGHGLQAAAVMGMLRSALSAAIRAVPSPAQALEVLGLYARAVDGALATTVAKVLIDPRSRLIIYSNAGHPPPVLLHPDGSRQLLDQATDPPLGARPEHVPRPQAVLSYTPGDTLVLYTDGLIERRGEDIDIGLARLTDSLAQYSTLPVEELADALLAHLGVDGGGWDDIALVVVRL